MPYGPAAMNEGIISCYPTAGAERPLAGVYLDTPLPDQGRCGPFVYANYVTSLDGRISVPTPAGGQTVPGNIANPRDWRLLEELAGPADLLLSSGRYLRELNAGQTSDILPVGTGEALSDIRAFRARRGLAPQPDVAVLSMSLDFAVPDQLLEQGRRVIVITGSTPDERRVQALERTGVEVIALPGTQQPGGEALAALLGRLGYRRIYAITGPYVMHTLITARVLDTLYLTTVHRIIGGSPFASICEGDLLSGTADFSLASLYVDAHGPDGCTQTFARYDLKY